MRRPFAGPFPGVRPRLLLRGPGLFGGEPRLFPGLALRFGGGGARCLVPGDPFRDPFLRLVDRVLRGADGAQMGGEFPPRNA